MANVAKRALFVCNQGHIFRSLVKLKNGRVRQCSRCSGIVTTKSCKSIGAARLRVREITADADLAERQKFSRGKIRTARKKGYGESASIFEESDRITS